MTLEDSILVEVENEYLEDQSMPDEQRYVFAYHISISNRGKNAATLRRRHWFIADGNGDVSEVEGDGVVGNQPTIEPNETYRYSSGSVLQTEVGSMRGYFEMEADDGSLFHASIPVFTLATPHTLN